MDTTTCIVGLVYGPDVYIGGDSAGVREDYQITTRRDEKVFRAGEMIFGFTTSFRMGQILRYSFSAPKQAVGQSDMEYLCGSWIDAVIAAMKDKGYAKVKENEVSGGAFLIGFHGSLYFVQDDFQVGSTVEPYFAVGCGAQFALGALRVLEGRQMDANGLVIAALEAAEHFSCAVRRPFVIERLAG